MLEGSTDSLRTVVDRGEGSLQLDMTHDSNRDIHLLIMFMRWMICWYLRIRIEVELCEQILDEFQGQQLLVLPRRGRPRSEMTVEVVLLNSRCLQTDLPRVALELRRRGSPSESALYPQLHVMVLE